MKHCGDTISLLHTNGGAFLSLQILNTEGSNSDAPSEIKYIHFFFLFSVISQIICSRITLKNLSRNAVMKAVSYGISEKREVDDEPDDVMHDWWTLTFLMYTGHSLFLKMSALITEMNPEAFFFLSPRLSEVKEHGCGCASPWKWWWPRGRLCLADNKNGARMSWVSVLKWAKSSKNCLAACRKDSFQTDMTQWHPELRDLRFLRTELSQRSFWISKCREKKKSLRTKFNCWPW